MSLWTVRETNGTQEDTRTTATETHKINKDIDCRWNIRFTSLYPHYDTECNYIQIMDAPVWITKTDADHSEDCHPGTKYLTVSMKSRGGYSKLNLNDILN